MIASMAEEDWRTHSDAGWQVSLPPGVGGGPVKNLTNPELTTAAIFRGWVGDDAIYVAVMSRPREHSSLKDESRKLSKWFTDGPTEGALVDVPGSARGARRAGGLMDVDEGYGDPPHWTERVTYVVA